MQENYLISILGKQNYDGELGEVQLTTVGSYITRAAAAILPTANTIPDEPAAKITSILKVDGNRRDPHPQRPAALHASSSERASATSAIDTGFGTMMVGVFADRIKSDLDDTAAA